MPPQQNDNGDMVCIQTVNGQSEILVTDSCESARAIACKIAAAREGKGDLSAFNLFNLDVLIRQVELWKSELPSVEMHYAVKCNDDMVLLRTLEWLGVGFDCASAVEIDTVLSLGVSPDRIIFAHPCKSAAAIRHADEVNVRLETFDSIEELRRIERLNAKTDLLLRINVADDTALVRLADKFGAEPKRAAPEIIAALTTTRDSGRVRVRGICFHIGYGVRNSLVFREALAETRRLFDLAAAAGVPMDIVDIGGGYPGDDNDRFREMASVIRSALADFFPPSSDVRILGEPGQFVANQAVAVVANVVTAIECAASEVTGKDDVISSRGFKYFINDGAFCSFSRLIWGKQSVCGVPLLEDGDGEKELFPCRVWGPTADSTDLIEKCARKPRLAEGDWLFYPNMGAYSSVLATSFNGFTQGAPAYVISKENWKRMQHENGRETA